MASDTQARLHIQHLSAGESVDVVRFCAKDGAKVSAEVTPQHFSLTEQAVLEIGTMQAQSSTASEQKILRKFWKA